MVAVWLTGGARRTRLDHTLVLRRLREDLPGFDGAEVVIDAAGATAIVAMAGDATFALAFTAGDKVVVRPLAARDIRTLSLQPAPSGMRLVIDTGDFTHGRFELSLPTDEAERWRARLSQLPAAGRAA
ncbi:MAG TPA: hypothetical protein VF502_06150 [Stellaceae bacterium]